MNNSKPLIPRPLYENKLRNWLGHEDLVKIVTGVRRCGKSKLFALFQDRLLKSEQVQEDQIININLEKVDQRDEIGLHVMKDKRLESYKDLLQYITTRLVPNKMNYVFIDEIQLLVDWQELANTLRLKDNVDVYLTGSNAYMFSSDLANSFGGRYVEIKMYPYSFAEFCYAYKQIHKKEVDIQTLYQKYITESGFPQTVDFMENAEQINDYLMNTVYYNTIQKDIVRRFNIADDGKLDNVTRYIFDNIGNETSLRKIEGGLKAAGQEISVPTINIYLKGLLDSYLVHKCDRYDIRGKQYLNSNSKYYITDIGLRTAMLGRADTNMGHILENIVYLELLRRGYRVSVGKVHSKVEKRNKQNERKTIEVDFVATKGEDIEYYQVALYALVPETLERELEPLREIEDNYPKYILSLDFGSGKTDGIERINILDWLLQTSSNS